MAKQYSSTDPDLILLELGRDVWKKTFDEADSLARRVKFPISVRCKTPRQIDGYLVRRMNKI